MCAHSASPAPTILTSPVHETTARATAAPPLLCAPRTLSRSRTIASSPSSISIPIPVTVTVTSTPNHDLTKLRLLSATGFAPPLPLPFNKAALKRLVSNFTCCGDAAG